MTLNPLGELLGGSHALPLQGGPPVLEKAAGPTFLLVVPQLAEGLFEQVSSINLWC
jgi:hypothetical protein